MATDIPVQGRLEVPAYIAAASQMEYVNDGNTILTVLNSAGIDVEVKHKEAKVCNHGHPLTDAIDVVPAGDRWAIWKGHQVHRFNDPANQDKVLVEFDSTANVFVYCYTTLRT